MNDKELLALYAFRIYRSFLGLAQKSDDVRQWRLVGITYSTFKLLAYEADLNPCSKFFAKIDLLCCGARR